MSAIPTSASDPVLDTLTDESGDLRLMINRKGAEMVSLARRDAQGEWRGFLYRDGDLSSPAAGWGNHATVMGYFLHRLWKERSTYRGTAITGGNHGFLRHFDFDSPSVEGNSLVYHVPVERIPPGAYPLKVSLDLTYRLREGWAMVEFAFTNHEPDLEAHVGFGLHPGFAVGSLDECRLVLPAGTYVRYMAPGNFLDGNTEEVVHDGTGSPFPMKDLPDSYILGLEKLTSREIVLEDFGAGRRLVLDFSEVPYLTLWSDMHPFLCVEPCWGLPDTNPPTTFENKPGIQHVPPGKVLRAKFGIKPELVP